MMRFKTFAHAAAMAAAMLAGAAEAQAAKARVPSPQARTVAPKDISGVWELYPDPFAGEENTFRELPVPGDGPKLRDPYAAQWKALRDKRDAALKAGTPLVDPSTQCMPEGMPMIMGAIFPIEILQTPGRVTVLAEFLTQTRRIYLNRAQPKMDDITPSFYGLTTGRWEGNTLVLTTRGVKEDVRFFEIPHSAEMTITERIRRTGPELMEDQITIEDPKMLLKPYRFTYGYKRNRQYEMMEYFCERDDPLLKVKADGTVEMKTSDEIK